LKRVVISWELDRKVSWPDLAARLLEHDAVLCVVNLREHASQLFDATIEAGGVEKADGTFHLSTRMCAAHRLLVIAEIKRRLKEKRPCRVITTQLIEAGVDLDFPVAFRALGPLDAVFQVAGRADREGLLTAAAGEPAGRVVVFCPEDERMPPNEYKEAAGVTLSLVRSALLRGKTVQPESMECMETYWNRYYGEGGDRNEFKFATLAREFEMISDRTLEVFVPFDDAARSAIDELLRIGRLTRDLRRRLQRYVVGLRPNEFARARGVLEEIRKDSGMWAAVDRAYTGAKGLKLELTAIDTIL
jgi:CRISPR-associated endonuclease/helicase Cas3